MSKVVMNLDNLEFEFTDKKTGKVRRFKAFVSAGLREYRTPGGRKLYTLLLEEIESET